MSSTFVFVGGDVSLDLVNTLLHRHSPAGADDLLGSADEAERWFGEAGLSPAGGAAGRPDALSALHSARRLRAALDALYRPIAHRQTQAPAAQDGLDVLNAVLNQGRVRVQLVRSGEGFGQRASLEALGPPDLSVQVAHAAAALLGRLEPHRLKECEHPECDLLFYDESRNASRRWCDMQACGNLAKQARHRSSRRARQATAARLEPQQKNS